MRKDLGEVGEFCIEEFVEVRVLVGELAQLTKREIKESDYNWKLRR